MRESDYYAPGSYNDANSPWNEVEVPEREFNIGVEFQLSKKTTVESNNYYIDESPDGSYIDTEDIKWQDEYKEQHKSPVELISLFKKKLEEELANTTKRSVQHELEYLIDECSYWDEECYDIYEE